MILAYLLLFTGLTISAVAIYYSVVGLTAIFSAAAIPIMIMGVSLEVAKLVCATWIKQYWTQVPRLMKTYMVTAVVLLMIITSMGIFGFLSKAHNDQTLVSGDVGSKIAIYDEKIRTARDNIDAGRKQLQQMDAAVDQVMSRSSDEKGADKAVAIRNGQKRDRAAIAKDIEANQTVISKLNDEAAPIRAENRKVEAEVGPIKYIAAFIYGVAPDSSMLEKAVTWIIILIVIVFDPLAVIMLLASQMTFAWQRGEESKPETKSEIPNFLERFCNRFTRQEETATSVDDLDDIPVFDRQEPEFHAVDIEPDYTDYSEGALVATKNLEPEDYFVQLDAVEQQALQQALEESYEDPEPEEELPVTEKKPKWAGFSFPMLSHILQPKEQVKEEPVLITRIAHPESNANYNTSMDERPGDYVEAPTPSVSLEAAPGINRGINTSADVPATGVRRKYSPPTAQADNVPELGKAASSDFGNTFPTNPTKGDVFVRVDYLPNRLYKYNGKKWIEVDKSHTDLYAYNDMYIKHLIDQIDQGSFDVDSLNDVEREQISEYLRKNG